MQDIPLALVKAGMVVAKEIKSSENPASMTICGKGVKLTESLINRLQQIGIQAITVEGHPMKIDGEATLEEMLLSLEQRFRRVEDDPLMMKIKELYRKNIRKKMGEHDGR